MLMEELRALLGPAAVPPFDPRGHADRYRSLPKAHRRMVNALVRAGGELTFADLSRQTEAHPAAIVSLQAQAVLYALPAPQKPERVILPLEPLFATPLHENDPDKLVEALKLYPRPVLDAVAAARQVPSRGVDEYTLRARLHHLAISGATLRGVPPAALAPLEFLRTREWAMNLEDFLKALRLAAPYGWLSVRELFDHPGLARKGTIDLFLRMLIVPVRTHPGSSEFRAVGVPRELRDKVQEAVAGLEISLGDERCVAGRAVEWTLQEGSLRGDLIKYALLIAQDPPAVTQRSTVNRQHLNRMAKRAAMEPARVEQLNAAAVRLGLLNVAQGRVCLTEKADALLSRPAAAFARALADEFRRAAVGGSSEWWFGEAQTKKASSLAQSALLKTLTGPDATACVHCVARALASSPEFLEVLGSVRNEGREVAESLVESLARILFDFGLAEGYRQEHGVAAIRWTRTATHAFGPEAAVPAAAEDAPLVVQPSGEIIAPCSLPFGELKILARAADIRSVDAVAVFSLTRASLLRAAQKGRDPAELRKLLVSRSRDPLPQPVAYLLEEIERRVGEVEIIPCSALVRVRDPMILMTLKEHLTPVSDHLAALAPGRNPLDLVDRLKKAGYLARVMLEEAARAQDPPRRRISSQPSDSPLPPCDCYVEANDEDGILERLEHALEETEPVEISVRGGRREMILVDDVDDDRVLGEDYRTGREVAVSVGSILSARVVDETVEARRS